MSVLFLSNDGGTSQARELEAKLRDAIPELVAINNLSEIPTALRGGNGQRTCILMTGPANDQTFLSNLIKIATRNRETVFFILISDDISAIDYKKLVQTGGADWASSGRATQEVLEIMRRVRAPSHERASADQAAPVAISFVPSAGGVGNSKLAIEVGVWLKTTKATRSRRVALIDLDFQTSHVCSYLDIEPKFRIEEIAQHPERLDDQLFDIFKSRHPSGLDVIAAPRSKFDLNDFSIDVLDALFEMASKRYDLILIDLPVAWSRWTKDVVANSNAVIVTGLNTVPCLHQIMETLTAVRATRPDSFPESVVVNRCQSGIFGGISGKKQVQRALARQNVIYVRDFPVVMTDTINTGVPLVSGGNRKAAKEIGVLARYCADVKAPISPSTRRSPESSQESGRQPANRRRG
jgi:pilus assembly protein CpaE